MSNIRNQRTLSALLPMLQDKDIRVRRKVVVALGCIISPYYPEEAVHEFTENEKTSIAIALVKLLGDEDEEVRRSAALFLGQSHNESISPQFIEALKHENSQVRAYAAKLLGIFRYQEATESLIAALEDKNPSTRVNAACALVRIGDESVIPLLIQMLADEKNSSAREIIINGLGETDNAIVIPTIVEILQEDKNPSARVIAIRALQNIGGESAEAAIIDVLLNDENYIVCDRAASALGIIAGEKSVVALTQALSKSDGGCNSDSVLDTIIESLGKIGTDSAIEAILKPLPSNTCLDSFATNILRRVGSLKIIPQLWNIQIQSKYKANFCDAIANIQLRHQVYNPEL